MRAGTGARALGALVLAGFAATSCGALGNPFSPNSPSIDNTQPVQVNLGPAGDYVNGLFTSVTICVPGTSSCQTVNGVLVDSGSTGLRLLSSAVRLPLAHMSDSAGSPLANCASFADLSYAWGPMAKADVRLAGEQASSLPLQLIGDPALPDAPDDCSSGGTAADTVEALGANGILGIGVFRQDCGEACARLTRLPAVYFSCPAAGCDRTSVPVANQLQNPVWMFPQDNNGYLVSLPAVPELGARSITGSLVFGIGTQDDNALGSARVYTTDDVGDMSTVFNGQTLSGYLDTGTNGIYFLSDSDIPLPACPGDDDVFSCPPTTVMLSATNTGRNGTSAPVSFRVANAETLFSTDNVAFDDLAGPDTGDFAWGLPFFFGRNTFIGIEGQTTPGGTGPYFAY